MSKEKTNRYMYKYNYTPPRYTLTPSIVGWLNYVPRVGDKHSVGFNEHIRFRTIS